MFYGFPHDILQEVEPPDDVDGLIEGWKYMLKVQCDQLLYEASGICANLLHWSEGRGVEEKVQHGLCREVRK